MKKFALGLTLILLIFAAGCSSSDQGSADSTELKVTDGAESVLFSVADLENLPSAQAAFQGVTYQGVSLGTLLREAGFDPDALTEVEAVAQDGFSATYTPDLFQLGNTLVAYAEADGPMAGDDGTFRMVLPDQGGKFNVRQLIELRVNP